MTVDATVFLGSEAAGYLVLDVTRRRTALILKGRKVHGVTSQNWYFTHSDDKTHTLSTWQLFTPRTNRYPWTHSVGEML